MSDNLKQKTYILENLGCANCAAKMERKIQSLPEVDSATITFATKQLRIETKASPLGEAASTSSDPDVIRDTIQHICSSIESEVVVREKDPVRGDISDAAISSGIDREAKNSFFSDYKADIITLVIGAVLFAAGVILEHIWGYDMWFAGGGRIVLLTFTIFIASYILLGHKVLLTAVRNICHGQIFDENFLMSIATIAAFCIGEFAEGAGVMLFYRIGELFENMAVERSRAQIMDAVDMRPETVMLVDDSVRIIPAGDANAGDILLVRPGDRIPLDGIVIEGESRVDTSPVTGEPVPVRASVGNEVISGCINENSILKIRVTKPLSESMVTRILDSVENAAAGKPKIDKFITKFARIYTPIIVSLAILTAVIPSLITGDWESWIKTAITFLVISCPCALVISVPLAFFSGIGAASKLSILFKGGLAIEAIKNIKAVIMDKTGTITKGVFTVDSISTFGDLTEDEILAIAAACESSSTHPIAVSILEKYHMLHGHEHHDHCDCDHEHHEDCCCGHEHHHEHDHDSHCDCGCDHHEHEHHVHCSCEHDHHDHCDIDHIDTQMPKVLAIEEIAGMGIKAQLAGGTALCMKSGTDQSTALCGNRALMERFGIDISIVSDDDTPSGTEVLIAVDSKLAGRIIISDQLKNDSVSAIDRLRSMKLIPAILTGDNPKSAEAIASSCGITNVHPGLLPEDKLNVLGEIRDEIGPAMFVGDGINDAPVLAGADVGAAMGTGADAAIEAADVVFMTSSLEAVPQSIEIARYTGRIAKQNIIFALAVKLLVILLGLAGFANIWAAVFADTGVAMLCILNSLRVLWRKYS